VTRIDHRPGPRTGRCSPHRILLGPRIAARSVTTECETGHSTMTCRPAAAASSSRREYQLSTLAETAPHDGRAADLLVVVVWRVTRRGVTVMVSR
jgi:hypothetical protein